MNIVDSSGWPEYFADGLNAGFFALTRAFGAVLWTQDADFEGMEGVRYIQAR